MVVEEIHQDRSLPDERNRQRKCDQLHRPLQPPGKRGHAGKRSGGQRGGQHRLAERPGNQSKHRDMHKRQSNQRLCNDSLK
jgi:hypothetical protein